ncbi:hypothetical protein B738_18159 [Photorhabdus temperata subsp. temperata M1021]|nr:hypothetical protein B738_18159 [Photorhabdus temperata subsp. temperata M1021]
MFLTWRQAPLSERNLIKTKCRIKNQHFVNNLSQPYRLAFFIYQQNFKIYELKFSYNLRYDFSIIRYINI